MKITFDEAVIIANVLQHRLDNWSASNGGANAAYNAPPDSWCGQAAALLRRLEREIFWHNNMPDKAQKWADFDPDC